jgi:ankyrin repeat protein
MAPESPSAGVTERLIRAIRRHDTGALEQALAAKPDGQSPVDGTDASGRFTPLLWAIKESQPAAVELLLAAGADPNLGPSPSRCPLAYAVSWREYAIAAMLLRSPRLDLDRQGFAAAMEGALGGLTEGIQFLVENGLDLRAAVPGDAAATHHGSRATALMFSAISVGMQRPALFRLLLEQGGDAAATGLGGHTLTGLLCSKANEYPETLQVLLDAGADPSVLDGGGFGPLHFAAGRNHHQSLGLLLRAGASPGQMARDGSFPLLWAAANSAREAHANLLAEHDTVLLQRLEHAVEVLPPVWFWSPPHAGWGGLSLAPGDGAWHGDVWADGEARVMARLGQRHGTSRGRTSPCLVVRLLDPVEGRCPPRPWIEPGRFGEFRRGQICELSYLAPLFAQGIPSSPVAATSHRFALVASHDGDPPHRTSIGAWRLEIRRIVGFEDGMSDELPAVRCDFRADGWTLS